MIGAEKELSEAMRLRVVVRPEPAVLGNLPG